jgi:predicted TIM-barrel fold metal-dependent hydrolase
MLIIDSQVHIWKSGTPVPIHRQIPSYTKDDLLREMDGAGVDAALLHPPCWDPEANEIAVDAAAAHPDRLAVLGFFDADRAESRSLISTWKAQPGMLGLRFAFLRKGQENWLTDGTMGWVWPAAEQAGLPVGLLVPKKLRIVAQIAERHPSLKLLIDHMARVRHTKDDAAFADLDELLALAKYPNLAIKASGMPSYSSHAYPYRNIHTYLRRAFDAFGSERMFWGTDITRMPCTMRQCVTMYTEEMPWLTGRDLDLVMGRALCDWIGWKIPARRPE